MFQLNFINDITATQLWSVQATQLIRLIGLSTTHVTNCLNEVVSCQSRTTAELQPFWEVILYISLRWYIFDTLNSGTVGDLEEEWIMDGR